MDTPSFQRVTRTHHDHNDTHNTTQQHDHNTTRRQRQRQTETDRDRERRQGQREKRRRKRRDKTREEEKREDSFCSVVVHGFFCWCSDFLVNSVCARDFSLLNSVKYDSSLISFSAPWQVNSFFNICELFILCSYSLQFFLIFLIMQLQFRFFQNYLIMQMQFFLPELILHKYSVEGYYSKETKPGLTNSLPFKP